MNHKRPPYATIHALFILTLLFLNATKIQAAPSAFFAAVRGKAKESALKMAEKKEVNPEEAQKAAKDAATVAQAAYNVGINTKDSDFINIIKDIVKQYGIEPEFIETGVRAALKGIRYEASHSEVIAQVAGIDAKSAKKAAQLAIATYAYALAAGAHPRTAKRAASHAIKTDKTLGVTQTVIANNIAHAAAIDAGILSCDKALINLIKIPKKIKKIIENEIVSATKPEREKVALISISAKGEISIYNETTIKWIADTNELDATHETIQTLSINDRGMAWATTKTGKILFSDGITVDEDWKIVAGAAQQILVNNNNVVWMLSTDKTIYYRVGISMEKPEGRSWEMVPFDDTTPIRHASWIGLNNRNDLVAINNGKAYVRNETHRHPRGTSWTEVTPMVMSPESESSVGQLREIAINTQRDIWALNQDNKIFFRSGIEEKSSHNIPWTQIPGALRTLIVTPDGTKPQNIVYGIDTKSHLFARTGYSQEQRQGNDWLYLMTTDKFARLFISYTSLHNASEKYKADKSRRSGKRSLKNTTANIQKRIIALEKEASKSRGYQKTALTKKVSRLKKLVKNRHQAIEDKNTVEKLKIKEELKKKKDQEKTAQALKKTKKALKKNKLLNKLLIKPELKKKTLTFSAISDGSGLQPGTYSLIPPADNKTIQGTVIPAAPQQNVK